MRAFCILIAAALALSPAVSAQSIPVRSVRVGAKTVDNRFVYDNGRV